MAAIDFGTAWKLRNKGLVLGSDGAAPIAIYKGSGAPNGTVPELVALYVDEVAATVGGALYITFSSGDTWAPVDANSRSTSSTNASAIPVRYSGSVNVTTAGAETRTLAIPSYVGQMLSLFFQTDGGDCVVTAATAINAAGNTIITLNDANDSITLRAVHTGAALAWRVISNDGATLS